MKLLWFSNVKSIDDLKRQYKDLCKKYHPDMGGDTTTMQMINEAYKRCLEELKAMGGATSEHIRQEAEIEDDLMNKIQEIITVPGIEIEVCHLWIWVSGNTYAVKGTLKEKGFWFAPKKELWFWRPDYAKSYKSKGHTMPMEDIRDKYGSIRVDLEKQRFRSIPDSN